MTEQTNETKPAPDMQKTLGSLIVTVYVIGAFALIAYVVFFAFIHHTGISRDPGDWGTLGDYFGGLLNPVISFATLVVAYAVWKQQKEELKATKEALEEQAKTAEQQRQEQRFFDLLNLYHSTVASITLVARMSARSEVPVQYAGKEAIAHFFRSKATISAEVFAFFLELGFYSKKTSSPSLESFGVIDRAPESLQKQDLRDAWNQEETSAVFDHYFRVLFRVLSDSENLLGNQHFKYVQLLRSQLSRSELNLIGLNLWLTDEGTKMVPLVERYGLLKHLPDNNLRKQLQTELPPAIFGRNFAADAKEATPC